MYRSRLAIHLTQVTGVGVEPTSPGPLMIPASYHLLHPAWIRMLAQRLQNLRTRAEAPLDGYAIMLRDEGIVTTTRRA